MEEYYKGEEEEEEKMGELVRTSSECDKKEEEKTEELELPSVEFVDSEDVRMGANNP